jgi:DNA-binding response OmpR family regulator
MAANGTVLCIHRDPEQLRLLEEKGYGLVTATTGSDGLRLLMSRPVDAVVLEYYLGLLDGAIVADEIRHVRPHLPIVMVADPLELPHGALKSVDTLVDKSAGAHFLWAAVHFLLTTKAEQRPNPVVEAGTIRRSSRRDAHSQAGDAVKGSCPGTGQR